MVLEDLVDSQSKEEWKVAVSVTADDGRTYDVQGTFSMPEGYAEDLSVLLSWERKGKVRFSDGAPVEAELEIDPRGRVLRSMRMVMVKPNLETRWWGTPRRGIYGPSFVLDKLSSDYNLRPVTITRFPEELQESGAVPYTPLGRYDGGGKVVAGRVTGPDIELPLTTFHNIWGPG